MTTPKQDLPIPKSSLELLNSGLLVLGIKRTIEESAYDVIDQQTHGHKALNTRHTYSGEVLRALNDIKFTAAQLREVDVAKNFDGITYEPEDQVAYHRGTFYNLAHSLKDKVIQLLAVMLSEAELSKAYKDLESAKVKKFLDKNKSILEKIGIYEDVAMWLDSAEGPIGTTLRRRNDYHHYQNRQRLNKDLNDLKVARLMQQPDPDVQLTDYGKERMKKLQEDSWEKVKSDNVQFIQGVVAAITENTEAIASKLITHYEIPVDDYELAKIGAEYTEYLSSLKIVNRTAKDKIQPEVQEMVDVMTEGPVKDMGDEILAVYLVGSCARGEFVPGVSDINIYVITKSHSMSFESEKPVTLTILSEADLQSEEHKKDRFIIWSDGLLLSGKAYKFSEKDFPKPGILLCLLLNRGVIEKLEVLQKEVSELAEPTASQLRLFTIKATRVMMDYDYGVAMSNKPVYTPSRKEKIAHTKQAFPNEKRTLILEQAYFKGRMNQADFRTLIDVYLENARGTYAHLLKLEEQISVN